MRIFFPLKICFVGNPRKARSIVFKSSLKLTKCFYPKLVMAHAGACAKENGLMRIYVRAHVNQFANLYLRHRPAEREVTDVASSSKKYREVDVTMRYACVNQSANRKSWGLKRTREPRLSRVQQTRRRTSMVAILSAARRAHVDLTS